jgi:type II secretory pathway pseudopilin PulG
MISERLLLVAVAASALSACGNYSNEDLLFMSAVPSSSQLAVVLPAAAPAVTQAELAQNTHGGIATVNTLLDGVLGLVDTIRSYEPTSRSTDERIWGPFADSSKLGWQWKFVIDRQPNGTTFDYHLYVASQATPDTSVEFLGGTFDAAGGAKQGTGAFTAFFANVVAVGYPVDGDATQYNTLSLTYQNYDTPGSPVSAVLTVMRKMPDANGIMTASFSYEILTDGSGEITFLAAGNIVGGTGTETVTIHSQWLPSGAGMATLTITAGADIGATQTECWDATFEATYNDKPWSTTEDVNVGEMSAFCPTVPVLP